MLATFCLYQDTIVFLGVYWFLLELTSHFLDRTFSPNFKNIVSLEHKYNRRRFAGLTDDVCEQQGQSEREQWCRQGGALPVAAAVRLVEGKQWSGHAAAREWARRRGVHGPRRQGVALRCPGQQRRGTGTLLEQKLPVEAKYKGNYVMKPHFTLNEATRHFSHHFSCYVV